MRLAAAVLFAACAALGACSDSGTSGPDAQAAAGPDAQAASGPDAAAKLPFMSQCTLGMNDACETGLCFDFNSKGTYCTHACSTDADCEDPSPGCNGMGVCKAPGGGGGGGTGGG